LLLRLIFFPIPEMERLKVKSLPFKDTFFHLHLPIVFIATALVFLSVIQSEEEISSIVYRYAGYTMAKWLFSVILTSWAVNRLVPAFKGETDIRNIYTLMVFSTSFMVLSLSVSFILPQQKALVSLLGLFGLYYYYQGLKIFTGIPHERTVGFLLISLLIFAMVTILFEFFLGMVFGIPIHL
jgi:hypothetical protein